MNQKHSELTIRASRMPLALNCPPSLDAPYDFNIDSEAARLGNAVHEHNAKRISEPAFIPDDEYFRLLQVKYGLTEESDLKRLSHNSWKLWLEIKGKNWFLKPKVEKAHSVTIGKITYTGHLDVSDHQLQTNFVADHKTGFLDHDASPQIKVYGLLSFDMYPDTHECYTAVPRPRYFTIDMMPYTRDELMAWHEYVENRLLNERNAFNAGSHCSFCPRRLTCAAYRDWIQSAFELLSGPVKNDLTVDSDPKQIEAVYSARLALDKLQKEAQAVLRTLAEVNRGSLPLTGGFELRIESEIHKKIKYKQALPVLQERFCLEEQETFIKVSKTKLFDHVYKTTGKGQKKHAAEELMSALEAVDAVTEETVDKLVKRKQGMLS